MVKSNSSYFQSKYRVSFNQAFLDSAATQHRDEKLSVAETVTK